MSRYAITVKHGDYSDEHAAIGFDPPLRTFFLQGSIESEDDTGIPPIWLGAVLEEYSTLVSLVEAACARGYEIKGLTRRHVVDMLEVAGLRHEPRLGERLGIVI